MTKNKDYAQPMSCLIKAVQDLCCKINSNCKILVVEKFKELESDNLGRALWINGCISGMGSVLADLMEILEVHGGVNERSGK